MPTLDDVAGALTRAGFSVTRGSEELSIPLSGDDGDSRAAYLKLVRLADEASLLTFSTSYPFGAEDSNLDDARLGAHECTQWVPLGSFQVDDDGSLHFRYSLVIGDALPSDDLLVGLVGLIDFQQLQFGDYLAQLLAGEIGIDRFPDLVAAGEDSGD
jgi:hypothetical protein